MSAAVVAIVGAEWLGGEGAGEEIVEEIGADFDSGIA